jgi:hypothetical protein
MQIENIARIEAQAVPIFVSYNIYIYNIYIYIYIIKIKNLSYVR